MVLLTENIEQVQDPLERLTVDGAVTIGNKFSDDPLMVNGTIFHDGAQFKAVEGNAIVP